MLEYTKQCLEIGDKVTEIANGIALKLVENDLDEKGLLKQGDTYYLEDDITIRLENNHGPYLWIVDDRGEAFAWLFNIDIHSPERKIRLGDDYIKNGKPISVSQLKTEYEQAENAEEIADVLNEFKETLDYLSTVDEGKLTYTLFSEQNGNIECKNLDEMFEVIRKRVFRPRR